MQNSLRVTLADIRHDPGKIIAVGYKIIFLPYAVLFLLTLGFGVVANLAAYYFGVKSDILLLKIVPGMGVFAIALLVFRELVRKVVNRRSRAKSLNPAVQIINEVNVLRFVKDNCVIYTSALVIRPRASGIRAMEFRLGWNGDLQEAQVCDEDGCSVAISDLPEMTGIRVTADFGRTLIRNNVYSFEFALQFDNRRHLIRRFLRKCQPYLPEYSLTQTLILEDIPQKRFIEAVYSGPMVEIPISEKFKVSDESRHAFEIYRPIQGFSYKVAAQAKGQI